MQFCDGEKIVNCDIENLTTLKQHEEIEYPFPAKDFKIVFAKLFIALLLIAAFIISNYTGAITPKTKFAFIIANVFCIILLFMSSCEDITTMMRVSKLCKEGICLKNLPCSQVWSNELQSYVYCTKCKIKDTCYSFEDIKEIDTKPKKAIDLLIDPNDYGNFYFLVKPERKEKV